MLVESHSSTSPTALAALRDALRSIEGHARDQRPVLPFGLAELDDRLRGGGLEAALHEVAAERADWGSDAAATLFLASIAARTQGPVLWVVRTRDLFAPGLYQAGLDPARVLYAEARDDAELLALLEEGLRFRALGAVIGEASRVATAQTSRLQLAAEGGGTIALLLKRQPRGGGDPFAMPSAAVTRWRVGGAPSTPVPWDGLGPACWRVACVRQRGGDPFELIVEAADEAGRLALPARLVDRPVAAARAPARVAG